MVFSGCTSPDTLDKCRCAKLTACTASSRTQTARCETPSRMSCCICAAPCSSSNTDTACCSMHPAATSTLHRCFHYSTTAAYSRIRSCTHTLLLILLVILLTATSGASAQSSSRQLGYKIPHSGGYLIVAPHRVRASSVYSVHVSIYHMYSKHTHVRASLSSDGAEYAGDLVTFEETGSKQINLEVPLHVSNGTHKLLVEGLSDDRIGQPVFRNETEVEFVSKSAAVFITTDKYLYYPEQKVYLRVIATDEYLHQKDGTITTVVKDAKNNTVWRWHTRQLNFGLFQEDFEITYPINEGEWKIQVTAFGHTYEQPFRVELFFRRRFEVNVTMPLYVTENEFGIEGELYGEHMSGQQSTGNCTILARMKDARDNFLGGEIKRQIGYFDHAIPFVFKLDELREVWGEALAGKSLHVKVWVYDWLWVETQNGTATTRILRDGIVVRALGPTHRTFKPGFPFTVYFAVMNPDGSPYTGRYFRQLLVSVTHQSYTRGTLATDDRHIIPDDNILRVQVTPREEDFRVAVRVQHERFTDIWGEVLVFRYHSPKGVYLSITSSTETPMVDKYIVFNLRSTELVKEVNYLIISGGNIILSDVVRMSSRQTTFSLAASRQMVPHARIVVFYEHHSGDTISDALNFHVHDTRLKRASLKLNYGKDFSRDTIELIARGEPGAIVVTGGADYEMYRRGAATFLTMQDVIDELSTFDGEGQQPYRHVWYHNDDRWDETVYFPSSTSGMDAVTTFQAAGMMLFTNRNLTADPYERICNSTLGFGLCPSGDCYKLTEKCDGVPNCQDGYDEVICPWENYIERRPPDLDRLHRMVRYYNSMDWLWKRDYIKHTGSAELDLEVPESTDPYVINAVMIHPTGGLSLVENYVMHDCTRSFYMVLEAPDATRRGEQIGVRASIFNFLDERMEVLVVLHGSDHYDFVMVEDGGYVDSFNPKTKSGDIQIMVLMYPGTSRYVHFPVVPTIDKGELTVKVTAFSFYDRDEDELTISVRYDGCLNGDQTPYLIDLVNQGSQFIPAIEIAIPVEFIDPEESFHIWIAGSNEAVVQLFGDVVSPGFMGGPLDTDSTVGVPHDSADGYMFDFAVNMETLLYLRATDAQPENLDPVLYYMRSTLMRQYAYMQPDGSYKLFRRDEEPSLWLTAFTLRWLHEAYDSEWREVLYMDGKSLDRTAYWITQQQTRNGSFSDPTAVLHDRKMNSTSVDHDGVARELNVSLTAYVTIQLSTLSRIRGDAKQRVDAAKALAADYLANQLEYITEPYQMAILAYALYVTDHNQRQDAYLRLKDMRWPGSSYWASIEIERNPSHLVDTIPVLEPRPDWTNMGSAMEATSYALMLYINNGEPEEEVISIMKWMQTQRTGTTSWAGTQDTILTLEALKTFALTETNRFIYNMQVEIQNTQNPGWVEYYRMNSTTFVDLYETEVPIAHGEVRCYASGTGYAVLQVSASYNVEQDFQMTNPGYKPDAYTLEMEWIGYSGRNASIMDSRVCASWNRPDLAPEVGLSVIMVEIPSGYVVARDSIEAIYNSHVPGLKRARFRDGGLIILFEKLTLQRTCFTFRAERWYPVANVSIQYMINSREYAEAGTQFNTLYESYTLHHLHICQVCGSFQCPYCPDYNTAATHTPHPVLYLLLTVLSSLLVCAGLVVI